MARKIKSIHYIYKTTCNVTGRYYIGMHSTSNEDDGYMGSGKRLRYSIRKYGVENHTKEILEYCDSRELLVLRETEIVNDELLCDELCMNLCLGGQGGFTVEQQKINNYRSYEKQLLLRENPLWVENKSKNQSNGIKKAYEDGKIKKYYFHDWNGKKHSEETRKLISKKMKNKGEGETNSQFGTCWITKEGDNKKINKENLENFLNDGWTKGRKLKKNG